MNKYQGEFYFRLILPHPQIILITSSLKYTCSCLVSTFFSFPSSLTYSLFLLFFLIIQPLFQVSVTLFTLSHSIS